MQERPSSRLLVLDARNRVLLFRFDNKRGPLAGKHWTELEREVMTDHRWWSQVELRAATEQVWPEDLDDMLINAGIWEPQFVGH